MRIVAGLLCVAIGMAVVTTRAAGDAAVFRRGNLVAWCIVPFDAMQRTPEQRAEMLQRIGISRLAYDWRAEHLPSFEREIEALHKRGIELTAVWFPATLDENARFILATLERNDVKAQLWVSAAAADAESAADAFEPIAREAQRLGCMVGIYNHGGWLGEPENQLAVIERLKEREIGNVGIVYNQHHGHDHVERFEQLMPRMKEHLLCLNLNGMTTGGDRIGKKILPIGEGELDARLLRVIRDSGYEGPIGILNHTDLDAEQRLVENLRGLERVVREISNDGDGERLGRGWITGRWRMPRPVRRCRCTRSLPPPRCTS
jgi:sugar phosphate isomerase/epimerase